MLAAPLLVALFATRTPGQAVAGTVHILVDVRASGFAQVEQRYQMDSVASPLQFRLLMRPCTSVDGMSIERAGGAPALVLREEGPWLMVIDSSVAPGTHDIAVRYRVALAGAAPDVPLLALAAPLVRVVGRDAAVRVTVRLPGDGRVAFPRLAREAGGGWSGSFVAIPSFVGLTRVGDPTTPCSAVSPVRDGGLRWRFALLVLIMGLWVPAYLGWARRSADGAD